MVEQEGNLGNEAAEVKAAQSAKIAEDDKESTKKDDKKSTEKKAAESRIPSVLSKFKEKRKKRVVKDMEMGKLLAKEQAKGNVIMQGVKITKDGKRDPILFSISPEALESAKGKVLGKEREVIKRLVKDGVPDKELAELHDEISVVVSEKLKTNLAEGNSYDVYQMFEDEAARMLREKNLLR